MVRCAYLSRSCAPQVAHWPWDKAIWRRARHTLVGTRPGIFRVNLDFCRYTRVLPGVGLMSSKFMAPDQQRLSLSPAPSDSEIRLGDWQTFQKFGAAGARCVPTMVGRAAKKILRSRQPFLIGKWPLTPRPHPYRLSAHSGVRKPDLLPSLLRTLPEWRLKRSAGLRPSASRFVPQSW